MGGGVVSLYISLDPLWFPDRSFTVWSLPAPSFALSLLLACRCTVCSSFPCAPARGALMAPRSVNFQIRRASQTSRLSLCIFYCQEFCDGNTQQIRKPLLPFTRVMFSIEAGSLASYAEIHPLSLFKSKKKRGQATFVTYKLP